ncbi:Na/Pi symporter [Niallia sp. Krafla_26]|uniref:Na/Pi symporter n=1 Tax=Niallia sp. Krafla_26 TaxID=3064703 RepID=UPI003D1788F4
MELILFLFILLIGLFIFGMSLLRSGLFHLSGDSLKTWLYNATNTPWKGFLAGILITCMLQSSSAVMIITIGLISAKMLSFPQSIGIILGTNIGTTVTTELITFDIQSFLIPMVGLAIVFLFIKKKKVQSIGLVILGISFVFMSMDGFEYMALPLREFGIVDTIISSMDRSLILSVIAGVVITAIIQSSTATTAIIMGFLSSGLIDLNTGIAILLGSNIGTCVDAFLASIGGGREARLTAYAHIWLNILGVVIFYPFIGTLAKIGPTLATNPEVQLAHISVIFNVICSIAVLPIAEKFGKLIMKIHGR